MVMNDDGRGYLNFFKEMGCVFDFGTIFYYEDVISSKFLKFINRVCWR